MKNKQSQPQNISQQIMHIVETDKPETVKQLVKLVQQEHSASEQEIMEQIIRLQNEGKLVFKEHQTASPSTLEEYMLSTNATWYWIIIALALATTAAVFTIPEEAFPMVYARYILGSIFVLWLPGYTFIKALFPTQVPIKTSSEALDSIERIALSLGMSLALVPIVGLLLNYTPWGIRLTPIVLSLLALTLTLATAALIREQQAKIQQKT